MAIDRFQPMIALEEAFRILDEAMHGIRTESETLPVREALGRVALTDQRSLLDLPPFDKSAMDGFAILAGDEREEYRVLETVAAGHMGKAALSPGTAVKVMTGAAIPERTGRVVIVENVEETGDRIKVLKTDRAENLCRKGEDVRVGDLVIPAGTAIGAVEIAALISCGVAEVEVSEPVRVAIISTGDEIVDSPELLGPGKIMNSNGPMLAGLALEYGLGVVMQEIVPDTADATEGAIRRGLDQADMVLLTGGVSVGEFDFVIGALSDLGLEVRFSRVAVQPGKPTVFATAGRKVVFGLPGNPVSVFVTFHLFAMRAVAHLTGRRPGLRELELRLASDYRRRRPERKTFVPARLSECGTVEPITYHGPAHLSSLVDADGFFAVPIGVQELRQGDEVSFVMLPRAGSRSLGRRET